MTKPISWLYLKALEKMESSVLGANFSEVIQTLGEEQEILNFRELNKLSDEDI